jgi:hypothetical protein
MTETGAPGRTNPVRVEARLDRPLSRWLWLVKWLLLIPHFVVLLFLWLAFAVTTVFAFFAVMFTGRYPRGVFGFNLGVLRWTWRVTYYGYSALGTDRYPPFTLGAVPDYPATLDIAYPERLSRGLVLVKWWLLALPHYLLLAVLAGGIGWSVGDTANRGDGGPGLLGLAVLFAGVALLFTRRYPAGLYDLVVGVNRWAFRVLAYAALMTDEYPPFRLDQGGAEPAPGPASPPAAPSGGTAAGTGTSRGTGAGAVVALVVGLLTVLPALGLVAGGGAVLWLDSERDPAGYVSTEVATLATETAAVTVEDVELTLEPDVSRWLADNDLGDVRVRVTSDGGTPLFVGIAPAADVDRWLAGTAHDEITRLTDDGARFDRADGPVTSVSPPAGLGTWAAQTSGTGTRQLDWTVQDGRWSLVIARTDGATGVSASATAATTIPDLTGWGAGLLTGGLALLVAGAALIVVGATGIGRGHGAGPAGAVGPVAPSGGVPASAETPGPGTVPAGPPPATPVTGGAPPGAGTTTATRT